MKTVKDMLEEHLGLISQLAKVADQQEDYIAMVLASNKKLRAHIRQMEKGIAKLNQAIPPSAD